MRQVFSRFATLFIALLIFLSPSVVPTLISSRPPAKKMVALTFDDGPHPGPTRELQRVLAKHQAPATFFIVGKVGATYPHVVTQLARAGHEIANHSWSHPNIQKISQRRMKWELNQTRRLIKKLTGRDTALFRTPGSTNHFIRKRFRVPNGYKLVMWDVHSLDQEGVSGSAMFDRVFPQIEDGDIVILHNGFPETNKAVDQLIPALRTRGFEFVTVSTLQHREIQAGRVSPRQKILGG